MRVDVSDGGLRLTGADDLGALSVWTGLGPPDDNLLPRTLRAAGAGEVAGDHVWLDVSWLRAAAGERDRTWHDGFATMLDHASAHGWLSADGRRVRAHVEGKLTQMDENPAVSAERYRHVLGHFVTGVTVVTAAHAEGPVGFTCQSFGAVSMDPPLVFLCPSKVSRSWPKMAASGRFGVNVLAHDQSPVARRFAVSGGDKFAGVPWMAGRFSGAPMLAGTLGWLDCEISTVHEAGDHWIVVARVLDLVATTDRGPLTFFRGKLGGSLSDDRAVPEVEV